MASHEVTIRENTGATKDAAPYLGNYAPKETVRLEAGSEQMSAKCGLPPIQVLAILSGSFEAIEALERESLVRVHTDIGVVCGVPLLARIIVIYGAIASLDLRSRDPYTEGHVTLAPKVT